MPLNLGERSEASALLGRDEGGHWYRNDGSVPGATTKRDGRLRIAVVAPKNTPAEARWLASLLRYAAEPYRRHRPYDVVWFFNVTRELRFLRDHTDSKLIAVAVEPKTILPLNYDPELLALCDLYLGYRKFAGPGFVGEFHPLRFPATTHAEIAAVLEESLRAVRPYDFCMFAKHDPNYRGLIGRALARRNAVLAGSLFGSRVDSKLDIQRRCKYEIITENDINDYYLSEKVAQALLGGCIPVYYGCTTVQHQVPAGLFVSLSEDDLRGDGLERVLDHLLQPEVVAQFQANLRESALRFLSASCTIEGNVVHPIEGYLGRIADAGFRSRRRSWRWWARALGMAFRSSDSRSVALAP
jgi:hypothetical protein